MLEPPSTGTPRARPTASGSASKCPQWRTAATPFGSAARHAAPTAASVTWSTGTSSSPAPASRATRTLLENSQSLLRNRQQGRQRTAVSPGPWSPPWCSRVRSWQALGGTEDLSGASSSEGKGRAESGARRSPPTVARRRAHDRPGYPSSWGAGAIVGSLGAELEAPQQTGAAPARHPAEPRIRHHAAPVGSDEQPTMVCPVVDQQPASVRRPGRPEGVGYASTDGLGAVGGQVEHHQRGAAMAVRFRAADDAQRTCGRRSRKAGSDFTSKNIRGSASARATPLLALPYRTTTSPSLW